MLQITDSAKEYLTSMTESERKRLHTFQFLGVGVLVFNINGIWLTEEKDGIVVEDILVVDKIAEMFVLGMHCRLCKRVWWKLSKSCKP